MIQIISWAQRRTAKVVSSHLLLFLDTQIIVLSTVFRQDSYLATED